MAVLREANLLGNQRVDIPHLRGIESAVRGDFDLLAGAMFAGKQPLVVSGFYVLSTGVTICTNLKIRVADSSLIHFLASESGSIFHVPADRPDEQLNSTNPRVLGSFTPGTVNYIGLDFVREADESTIDLVEFIDSDTELETPVQVPLARTSDYRIVISTLDFENNPGVCPIAKVTVDDFNNITDLVDSRQGAFRLGSGGTIPNIRHAFPWPAGREENTSGDTFVGGDKAIQDFKSWMDAIMTRLWEVGGGEFWYSPTNYGNERLARTGTPFVGNGEYFEWDGTNLHWKGLVWIFANSTAVSNTVNDQTTDQPGLTDLVDGECIYTDVDRTNNTTISAVKGTLTDLGTAEMAGSRYVIAWRQGAAIYTRDQSYAVNSTFKNATTIAGGMVRASATPPGGFTFPAYMAAVDDVDWFAYAGGLSRGSDFVGGSGDIQIGGYGSFDQNVRLVTTRAQDEIICEGESRYFTTGNAVMSILQNWEFDGMSGDSRNLTLRLLGYNDGATRVETAHAFDVNGAIGFRNEATTTLAPNPTAADPIRSKLFFKTNGLSTPATKDQLCIMWFDGNVTVLAESAAY